MPPLDTFTAEQQSFERLFPGKGPFDTPPQRVHRGVEEQLAPALTHELVAGCAIGPTLYSL
jgi:hypothetical protein